MWFLELIKKIFGPVNYERFFANLTPLFPQMSEKQKEGVRILLDATSHLPLKQRAYILATAYHETAFTMQPITEYGGIKYFDKYDTGRLAVALGNSPEKDGDGYKYRGRGYVMITGLSNYKKAKDKLGIDFVTYPDNALVSTNAAKIIVMGMSEGWFTGKKLSDYIGNEANYASARRIVNGTDKAATIKRYAELFETALTKL